LLGINSDKDKSGLRPVLKKEQITWRSFWNGPGGTGGPISSMYGVRGWPTTYVLDHMGVIRFKNARGEKLDEAVDQLIGYAEKADPTDAKKFAVVGPMAPVFRQWTDSSGKFKIDAEFVQFRDGKAHLKKTDGSTLKIAMTQLCKEDQEFIRDNLRKKQR